MAASFWVKTGGVWQQVNPGGNTGVRVGGTYQPLQSGWVRVAGTYQKFFQRFSGQTNTYNTNGSFTETIPAGAVSVTIEAWGASGGGSGVNFPGHGAGSGGYSKTILALTPADFGKTLAVTVGVKGGGGPSSGDGTAGTLSRVASGTKTITTMTGNGGGAGTAAAVGAGGTASGGNTTNTTGNPGAASGDAGGAGIVGTNGTGAAGGASGNGLHPAGFDGGDGLVIFKYT